KGQPPIRQLANRKALVMGNDQYLHVTKLVNARADARALGAELGRAGYKVTLLLDLNEHDMKQALRDFKAKVEGGDEVVVFYAGHGVQLGNANYLLPIDIKGDDEEQVKDEAIQLQRILDDMSERKAKLTLAVVDACRDNPFKSQGRAIGGRGLSPTTAATGQMIVFSAGTGQQALDKLSGNDKDPNSVFTRTFIKEMAKPGLTVDRVLRNVRTQVVDMARSVGHEQVPALYDQVVGDFYFRP
ncbi:MAG: caspase family protein, partial [Rhodoferax sp.]|nr:caspase family protein [Rhodoferax sp.]